LKERRQEIEVRLSISYGKDGDFCRDRARLERGRFYQEIETVLFKDQLRCLGLQERKISHRIRFGISS
jgi:hypothetical protein